MNPVATKVFVVEDTAEGREAAVKFGMDAAERGEKIVFDYSMTDGKKSVPVQVASVAKKSFACPIDPMEALSCDSCQ